MSHHASVKRIGSDFGGNDRGKKGCNQEEIGQNFDGFDGTNNINAIGRIRRVDHVVVDYIDWGCLNIY